MLLWNLLMVNPHSFNISIWMDNFKEINIKNFTYYFSDDIININDLDPDRLKVIEYYDYTLH